MKLHIISDGTPQGTKVLDENDKVIERITKVSWSINAEDGLARVVLEVVKVRVDVVGEGQ